MKKVASLYSVKQMATKSKSTQMSLILFMCLLPLSKG